MAPCTRDGIGDDVDGLLRRSIRPLETATIIDSDAGNFARLLKAQTPHVTHWRTSTHRVGGAGEPINHAVAVDVCHWLLN